MTHRMKAAAALAAATLCLTGCGQDAAPVPADPTVTVTRIYEGNGYRTPHLSILCVRGSAFLFASTRDMPSTVRFPEQDHTCPATEVTP